MTAEPECARRLRAAWTPDLVFPGYQQERWVDLQRYQERPWRERHNLDQIATRAPTQRSEQTLDYFMHDYVDHLELHLRQILGEAWPRASR